MSVTMFLGKESQIFSSEKHLSLIEKTRLRLHILSETHMDGKSGTSLRKWHKNTGYPFTAPGSCFCRQNGNSEDV